MYDIVIVGAGTAGLSAAIYGARADLSVLVLEGIAFGGQIINALHITNYPGIQNISGFDFAIGLHKQAVDLGARVEIEQVLRLSDNGSHKTVYTNAREIPCKTVILATGAKNRPLGLAREQELTGRGIAYCATCDGAFFRDKVVAVVGAGNTAVDDAIFLSQFCSHVYLIHRRQGFRAQPHLLENLRKRSNVSFILDTVVTQLNGAHQLESLTLQNKLTGETSRLDVQGLFVAIGQDPANGPFSPPVDLDATGYIAAGEHCKTNVPGIFAAGDCRAKTVRQLVTAASDGAVAALAAASYIEEFFSSTT